MKKVNGYYIRTIKMGMRGFEVVETKGYEKENAQTFKETEIKWFKKFSEAKDFANSLNPGKSN